MSEEAAFLAALKANPADDVARLVYADWLDEHDEPQKAEYLRAVADLARTNSAPGEDFITLSGEVPSDWRLDTAARFTLVLESFEQKMKILTIKAVRTVIGMGIGEAAAFVEQAPSRFPFRTTPEGADGLARYFTHAHLRVESDIADVITTPVAGTFVVAANLKSRGYRGDESLYPEEARIAFLAFVASVLGTSLEKAAEQAGKYHFATFTSELNYPLAQAELKKLCNLLAPDDPTRQWAIQLDVHPTCATKN